MNKDENENNNKTRKSRKSAKNAQSFDDKVTVVADDGMMSQLFLYCAWLCAYSDDFGNVVDQLPTISDKSKKISKDSQSFDDKANKFKADGTTIWISVLSYSYMFNCVVHL